MRHMNRSRLCQPYVPIDSGAFIKPSFSQCSVDSHRQYVLAAESGKVCQVKKERRVPAEICPDVVAIQNQHGITKRPVELHGDALARVGFRKLKDPTVPANARLRIVTAERFAAVVR